VIGSEKPLGAMATASFWRRRLRLVERRALWCPTWVGSFCIVSMLVAPAVWWCCDGESFLSLTERRPAEVLVVEGWIGPAGVRAAAAEFAQGGYKYVVASGGLTKSEGWQEGGWSYAEGAQHELIRSGVAEARVIVGTAADVERQFVFESAVAVFRAIQAKGIHPKNVNVFTFGPHARRTRLVFAKVFQPETKVGAISWVPLNQRMVRWWHDSDRAKDLLIETAGYLYEACFNSGRLSNFPDKVTLPGPGRESASARREPGSQINELSQRSPAPKLEESR
jgi:hypothetical protein